jgi:hypothetical protein
MGPRYHVRKRFTCGPGKQSVRKAASSRRSELQRFGCTKLNIEPLAKLPSGYRLRQGTTSVVPKMVNLGSGFSRCGIANN